MESIDMRLSGSKGVSYAAKTVSALFHPFVMPTLGVALLLFGNNYISLFIQPTVKYYLLCMVVVNTFAIPFFGVILLRALRVIGDYSLSERSDRILPLVITLLSYAMCLYVLVEKVPIALLNKMVIAATVSIAVCLTVNFFWQISLHLTAMGGVVGLLFFMNVTHIGFMPYTLLLFILAAGLLASSRLYLGKHDIWQVVAGFSVGFVSVSAFLSF